MDVIQIITICLAGAAVVGLVIWAVVYFIMFSEKKEKIYITALRQEGSAYIVDYYIKQKKDKLTYTKKVSEKVYRVMKVGRAYTVRIKGRKIDAVLKESVK